LKHRLLLVLGLHCSGLSARQPAAVKLVTGLGNGRQNAAASKLVIKCQRPLHNRAKVENRGYLECQEELLTNALMVAPLLRLENLPGYILRSRILSCDRKGHESGSEEGNFVATI
jgi:hypothetical protein